MVGVRGVSWEEGDWATRSILDTRSVVEEYDITPVSAVKKDSHDHNSRCAISKYNVPRIHDETRLTLGWFGALTPSDKQFSGQSVSLIAISNLWQPSGSILLALSGNLALPAWRIRTHIHQGCRHRWRRLGDRARAYGGLMFRVPSSAGFVWRDPHSLPCSGTGFRASTPAHPWTRYGRVAVRSKDTLLYTVSPNYRPSTPGICQVDAPNPNTPPVRRLRIFLVFFSSESRRKEI